MMLRLGLNRFEALFSEEARTQRMMKICDDTVR